MSDFRNLLETFDNQFPDRDYQIEIVPPSLRRSAPARANPISARSRSPIHPTKSASSSRA